MTRQKIKTEVLKLFEKYSGDSHKVACSVKYNLQLSDFIIETTNYLIDCKMSERLYHIMNDLSTRPLCKTCQNKAPKLINFVQGYREFCSRECSQTPENIAKLQESSRLYIEQYGASFKGKKHSIESRLAMSLKKHNLTLDDIDDLDKYIEDYIADKICPVCNINFRPTRRNQICCSKDCDAKRRDFESCKPKVCTFCQKEFYSNKKDQNCCGYHCHMKLRMSRSEEIEKLRQRLLGKPVIPKGTKMSQEWCDKNRERVIEFYKTEEGQLAKNKISNSLKEFYTTELGEHYKQLFIERAKLNVREKNAMYGKKHSSEALRKMSESKRGRHISEEHKQAISKGSKGHKKSNETRQKMSTALLGNKRNLGKSVSQETRLKISKANKGKSLSKETRQAISEAKVRHHIEHGNVADKKAIKGTYFSEKNKTTIKYDSSYELIAFEKLEQDDSVISYKKCDFSIPYFLDIKRNYLPDILVTYIDEISIIEIKPKYKLIHEKPEYKAKFLAALLFCRSRNWKFKVWTEYHLFSETDTRHKQAMKKVKQKQSFPATL